MQTLISIMSTKFDLSTYQTTSHRTLLISSTGRQRRCREHSRCACSRCSAYCYGAHRPTAWTCRSCSPHGSESAVSTRHRSSHGAVQSTTTVAINYDRRTARRLVAIVHASLLRTAGLTLVHATHSGVGGRDDGAGVCCIALDVIRIALRVSVLLSIIVGADWASACWVGASHRS